jgi:hypothetical protein
VALYGYLPTWKKNSDTLNLKNERITNGWDC